MIKFNQNRYRLFNQPSILHPLLKTSQITGHNNLYIKRDDNIETALGGNKLRSLEFWLGQAIEESADIILVAGAPISNQCRLTAAAAAKVGIDCLILHNGDQSPIHQSQSFLNKILGAKIKFLGNINEAERHLAIEETANQLRKSGRTPYIVGAAENCATGGLGYALAADEILQQSQQMAANIRHVILPGSMGTTEAGFIFGNAMLGNPFQIHLISVEYDDDELNSRIEKIYNQMIDLTGLNIKPYDGDNVKIYMDYLGDGYATHSQICEDAILTFARNEGIFLEYNYTGKTFAGFLDLIKKDYFPKDDGICIIHTGGTASLFSQFHMFEGI